MLKLANKLHKFEITFHSFKNTINAKQSKAKKSKNEHLEKIYTLFSSKRVAPKLHNVWPTNNCSRDSRPKLQLKG